MSTGQQLRNYKNLAYYCELFANLTPSKNKKKESGDAPYKPILLLSVIDLMTQGIIEENYICVSDELIENFDSYWNLLAADSSYLGGLHYPFIHLESEGFWHLEFRPELKKGRKIGTTTALKKAVEYARLDDELYDLIKDPVSVPRLIDALIESWFASSRGQIEEILRVNQDFQEITQSEIITSSEGESIQKTPKTILRKAFVRNAFFRKSVVHIYEYRCAFCHLKVIDSFKQNIVDGAHIKPFSQFFDSTINNGISLCKNHHWAFDQGWFTIDEDYKIIVSHGLKEDSPNAEPMINFHGKFIFRPNSIQYFPRHDALEWHRTNVFKHL